MNVPSVLNIPNFISSRTPQGLRELALEVQARLGAQVHFQITHDGKEWFGWYIEPIESSVDANLNVFEDKTVEVKL